MRGHQIFRDIFKNLITEAKSFLEKVSTINSWGDMLL